MRSVAADHDRLPGAPDPDTTLREALEGLRLEGAVFLRAEYREPWTYESMSGPVTANLLRPGTDRVLLFHLVAAGTCWVSVGGGPKHWASVGDVIVLPYGDQHLMGGLADSEVVPIATFMPPPPWTQMPVLRLGAEGPETDVVCGYLHGRDPLFDPALRVFPAVFVVTPPVGPAAEWVRANIEYALTQTATSRVGVPTRLPELLLVEILRLHLASAPAADHGWSAALRDPVLAPALAVIHARPDRKWTVDDLAATALVSRSALDARFRELLGRSPIRYLTQWRLHVAQDLLGTTDLSVLAVAHRVGYESEEAFSRAFKRSYGSPPSVWRA
ncbi:AraC family transcriptional regulator [Cellulomonas sp. McL0617]|uniref:AraC family transcriptional regulator n=1 Tax=Cellulomonas sp. McL0617 TaxID=3415675 RepID=UPI003CF36F54